MGRSVKVGPEPLQITEGWLAGHRIRRAPKGHRCDYWRGKANGGRCDAPIRPGDLYVEGEMSPDRAGGFGHDRYCFDCAGPEARAALAKAADPRDTIIAAFAAIASRIEHRYREEFPKVRALTQRAALSNDLHGELLAVLDQARAIGLNVPAHPLPVDHKGR
jgi:hypothetical protein